MPKTSVKRTKNSTPSILHADLIVQTVNNNRVSIICGTSESSQIAQLLINNNFEKLFIVSRTGYITVVNADGTKDVYIDGLRFIRELNVEEDSEKYVLIVEDCQDGCSNIEIILAWCKQKLSNDWKTKVVLLSTYTNTTALAKYMNAISINVSDTPTPAYQITKKSSDIINTICEYAKDNNNILVFVAGVRDINAIIATLKSTNIDATILPLYSDLTNIQATRETTKNSKIVIATNIAQSSVKVPNIDVVIDTGLERHPKIIDGLPMVTIGPISYADHIQRVTCANDTYIWCSDTPISELPKYPTPEIYTGQIDQVLLGLAFVGIEDIDNTKFFHQPTVEKINASKKVLRTLTAFDENNKITDTGRIMAQLPISVRYSRMIVKSAELGVLSDVMTIASLLEFGGIKNSSTSYSKFSNEPRCDMLAELDTFNYVQRKIAEGSNNAFDGIVEKNFYRVQELRSKLDKILSYLYPSVDSTGNRNDIITACATGIIDYLYVREENSWYTSPNDPFRRKLDLFSSTLPTKYLLGLPKNISLAYKAQETGQEMLYILTSAIMIRDVNFLKEIAPHLVHEVATSIYDTSTNTYYRKVSTFFSGVKIETSEQTIDDPKEKIALLSEWLAKQTVQSEHLRNVNDFSMMLQQNKKVLAGLSESNIKDYYVNAIDAIFKGSVPNLKKKKNIMRLIIAHPQTWETNPKMAACF